MLLLLGMRLIQLLTLLLLLLLAIRRRAADLGFFRNPITGFRKENMDLQTHERHVLLRAKKRQAERLRRIEGAQLHRPPFVPVARQRQEAQLLPLVRVRVQLPEKVEAVELERVPSLLEFLNRA